MKSKKQLHKSEIIALLPLRYNLLLLKYCLTAEQKTKYPSKLKQEHTLYAWCQDLFLFYRRKLCKNYLDAITLSASVFGLTN